MNKIHGHSVIWAVIGAAVCHVKQVRMAANHRLIEFVFELLQSGNFDANSGHLVFEHPLHMIAIGMSRVLEPYKLMYLVKREAEFLGIADECEVGKICMREQPEPAAETCS